MTHRTSVLFLCTGNICRSPLAEFAARSLFGEGAFAFSSAGTHAIAGDPATRNMREAAARHGLDISAHTATPLSRCGHPDIVFGMEQHHLLAAQDQFPDLDVSRIRLLDHPSAIADPYGLGIDDYRSTASHIVTVLESLDAENLR